MNSSLNVLHASSQILRRSSNEPAVILEDHLNIQSVIVEGGLEKTLPSIYRWKSMYCTHQYMGAKVYLKEGILAPTLPKFSSSRTHFIMMMCLKHITTYDWLILSIATSSLLYVISYWCF
jgi:hypothetical protein